MVYPDVSFAQWNSLLCSKPRSPGFARSGGSLLPASPASAKVPAGWPRQKHFEFQFSASSLLLQRLSLHLPWALSERLSPGPFSPLPYGWPELASATGTRTTQKSLFQGFRNKGFPLEFLKLKAGRCKLSRPYARNLIFFSSFSSNYPSRCNFILQRAYI